MREKWKCALAASVVGVLTGVAHSDYIMTPVSNGESSIEVAIGESFDLDILLSSDNDDVHNSAIFRVEFTEPGLFYESYAWSSPYETGSIFDDSKPLIDDLPVMLDELLLDGPSYPEDVVDVELSNVVADGAFGEGLLATMTLSIPVDYDLGSVWVGIAPDTIANGFDVIPTFAGDMFEIIVIPAPAGLLVFAIPLLPRRGRARRG